MGYISPRLTAYSGNAATTNPLDSTTYYFGANALALTTAAAANRIYILKAGKIRAAIVNCYIGGAGSAENVIFSIRINNTTSYAIDGGRSMNVSSQLWYNYAFDIDVAVGDYVEFTVATPAWATNPTSVNFNGSILVESA